jgi:tripartite-type tricarboxylate transporter receptor subunit TctC
MKRILTILLTITMISVLGFSVGAADYPSDQVQIIIPYSPGGASDTLSRMVGKLMEENLGVPFVGINRTGGSGAVGAQYLKNSKADGYTIGYVPVEYTMIDSLGFANITPDDFDFLALGSVIPSALTVQADSRWENVEEFIEYARNNPGEVSVGNSGTGSIWQVAAAAIETETGVQFNHVPFDGAAPAIAALLGGHIDAVTVSTSEVLPSVRSEDLKILAINYEERESELPNIPTMQELGYDVNVAAWGGFAAPKGISDEKRDILTDSLETVLTSDEFIEFVEKQGMKHRYMDSEEFTEFANEQYEKYSEIISNLDL